jgi:septal ring factor EnvC (AmiA/AmiB activator)
MAITDSPASLGTEMMEFCSKNAENNPLSNRKTAPECLFTAAKEIEFEFSELDAENDEVKESFSAKIKAMFSKTNKQTSEDFTEVQNAVEAVAIEVTELSAKIPADQSEKIADLTEQLSTVQNELKEFKAEVDGIDLHSQRPPAPGGNGTVTTDC